MNFFGYNYVSFMGLFTVISSLLCSFFVISYNPKKKLNILWSLFSLSVGFWGLGLYVSFNTQIKSEALFWGRFLNLSAIWSPILFFHFACLLAEIKKQKEIIIYYIFTLLYFVLVLIYPKLFVKDVNAIFSFQFYPTGGFLYTIFPFFYSYFVIYGLLLLTKVMPKVPMFKKNQILYTVLSLSVGFTGGATTFPHVFGYNIPPIGLFLVPIYIGLVSYAVIKHNLMDIDLAWRKLAKEIIYYSFLAIYTWLVVISLRFLHFSDLTTTTLAMFCLILFLAINNKFKNYISKMLIHKYNMLWHSLKEAGKIKTDIYEKNALVNILTLDIPKTLNIEHATFYENSAASNTYEAINQTESEKQKPIHFSNPIVEEFYATKSYIYLDNQLKTDPNSNLVAVLKKLNIDICFPFFQEKTLVGILTYGKKNNNTLFHSEDLEILNNIIKEAEAQLQNIYKVKNISEDVLNQYKNTYQVQILEESKRLGAIRDIKHFTDHSIKLINRLLNASQTQMFVLDELKKHYYIPNDANIEPIKLNNYLIKLLTETKDMVLTSTLEKWAKEIKLKEFVEAADKAKELNASIVIPLVEVTHVLGFLTISNKAGEAQAYSSDDFLLLSFICDKIQTSLSNIYANEKANIDVLTGLHNRRFLEYSLESEIVKSYKSGKPTSFIMADVDDFKFYNDAGGHDEGDFVLKKVAEILQTLIRPTDECFRFAGDEFSIVFPSTSNSEAAKVANRLKEEFDNHPISKELIKIFATPVTLSFGVSTFEPKKASENYHPKEIEAILETLIKLADEGLYKAKKKNKNCFYVSEPFSTIDYHIDLNSETEQPEEEREHNLDHPFYYEDKIKTARDFYKTFEKDIESEEEDLT